MTLFLRMFSRKWILSTALVIAACAVLIRLGFWQLDRLAQRRAFNARVLAQQEAPLLVLDGRSLNLDLASMEYREVIVRGEFDFSQEVALRNQALDGLLGYRLFTPLKIEGTGATVLVNRGFVSSQDYTPGDWETFARPGMVELRGVIRRSQDEADFGGRTDPTPLPGERLLSWNLANVARIDEQIEYPLLPVYIQQEPDPASSDGDRQYPVPSLPELELTEGPHIGYAVQWFMFAAILALGYPFFIRRESGIGARGISKRGTTSY